MLIEVVVCALALFFVIGAVIAIPCVRVGQRRRDVLFVKGMWYALVAAIPLVLHLPLAILYFHGSQIVGHPMSAVLDDPFWGRYDVAYLLLSPFSDFGTKVLTFPLALPYLIPFMLVGISALVVYLGRRFWHLSKRDSMIVLICLLTGWAFALVNASTTWWLG